MQVAKKLALFDVINIYTLFVISMENSSKMDDDTFSPTSAKAECDLSSMLCMCM